MKQLFIQLKQVDEPYFNFWVENFWNIIFLIIFVYLIILLYSTLKKVNKYIDYKLKQIDLNENEVEKLD